LDESSQIPVTLALRPLAAMKTEAQLIIVGDHKQMPPIQHLEPPEGAEYLVGSIQAYLIRRFNIKPVPLLLNYRSNSDLVEYARLLGYPTKLKVAERISKPLKFDFINRNPSQSRPHPAH
jgi:superfamily I DNA and/or RNA helicase